MSCGFYCLIFSIDKVPEDIKKIERISDWGINKWINYFKLGDNEATVWKP